MKCCLRFLRQAKATCHPVGQASGAVEAIVTVGAVLFDPVSGRLEFVGAAVPEEGRAGLGRLMSEQVIGQAEIAPVALAALTWHNVVRGRNVVGVR